MLKTSNGVPPWLSGFICAFHPATPGSSTKHTIYAFINVYFTIYNLYFTFGKDENKNRGLDWPIFKKNKILSGNFSYMIGAWTMSEIV